MIDERFAYLVILLNLTGGISYIISTLKGEAKPNRVTWFLWALIPMIAFKAQIDQGVGIQSLLTFMVGFNPAMVFLASFINKKSFWKITRLDLICGFLSLMGILFWIITKEGNFAIAFAIFADFLAGVPTLIKSWKAPETENWVLFLLSGIGAMITLLTVKVWNFETFAFPLYIFLLCFTLVFFIRFKPGKRLQFPDNK